MMQLHEGTRDRRIVEDYPRLTIDLQWSCGEIRSSCSEVLHCLSCKAHVSYMEQIQNIQASLVYVLIREGSGVQRLGLHVSAKTQYPGAAACKRTYSLCNTLDQLMIQLNLAIELASALTFLFPLPPIFPLSRSEIDRSFIQLYLLQSLILSPASRAGRPG